MTDLEKKNLLSAKTHPADKSGHTII